MSNIGAYRQAGNRQTHQMKPVLGKAQIKNYAGGYVFELDAWRRLERFLILGTSGPTYYTDAQTLTEKSAEAVLDCISEDGLRVVDTIVDISINARAASNDPALFALAMCISLGDADTKIASQKALPQVARIGTHLFHFLEFVKGFRGWGRSLANAVADWYNNKSPDALAYQVLKYQQRDGWSHRDALRLAHPKPPTPEHDAIYGWITQGELSDRLPEMIISYEDAHNSLCPYPEAVSRDRLTREMLPTEWLKEQDIWAALLDGMPMTALVRNLGNMTRMGVLAPMVSETSYVVDRLTDTEYWGQDWSQSRSKPPHPLQILTALVTYQQGAGFRGSNTWNPVAQIVDALDAAFYMSFGAVEPMNRRVVMALDISGSMGWGTIGNSPLTPRVASAAMAMVIARVESQHTFVGFASKLTPLSISPRQRLDDVIKTVSNLPFGSTDCSLPMTHATKNGWETDLFLVLTDNETWYGNIHPFQALREYREKVYPNARLAVVGMTATEFSIADPSDPGMLDVVGFDTATPNIISAFGKGKI